MDTPTRLTIIYSRIYYESLYNIISANAVLGKAVDETWKEVEKRGEALAELLSNYEDRIVEKLPKVTGYSWVYPQDSVISIYPIYPLPGLSSFSSPLTLMVREDPIISLGVLLHELSHVIVRKEFEDGNLQETIMSSIAIHIMEALGFPVKTTREHFAVIHRKRFDEDIIFIPNEEIGTTLAVLQQD
jgi:hypothetical protein